MTKEELEFLAKFKPVKLCGHGDDALYQTQWGARTISDALEMQALQRAYHAKIAEAHTKPKPNQLQVSDELMRQHLNCVDDYGCGLFEGEGS